MCDRIHVLVLDRKEIEVIIFSTFIAELSQTES